MEYRNGYVKYKKVKTTMSEGTDVARAKLIIELERTADFKKLVEQFNKSREVKKP